MSRSGLPRKIAIVGGGASGSIAAMSTLRIAPDGSDIILIEKRSEIGRGLAYSTKHPDHRLNVRASNMSVFADDPGHFTRWLGTRGIQTRNFEYFYASRGLYGDYVAGTLTESAQAASSRLHVINETALSVLDRSEDRGEDVEVRLADGTSLKADIAILATGHEEAAPPDRPYATRIGSPQDTDFDPDMPIMILGTGLSMADAWLTLKSRGHCATVIALSRRGLMPLGHRGHQPFKLDRADVPLGTDLTYFVRWFRNLVREAERTGRNWRDVVDGLRPFNQEIWRNWPEGAKRRFFEHTKPWWDIHRHRMAPEIRHQVFQALEKGSLRVVAARVGEVEPGQQHKWSVRFRHRHSDKTETVEVGRIYDCQGIVSDLSAGTNPLIRSMIASGTARPDLLRIGLDVDTSCAVINDAGQPSARIFAVGPPTRGAFLEIDAIPDIRVQADGLVRRLLL